MIKFTSASAENAAESFPFFTGDIIAVCVDRCNLNTVLLVIDQEQHTHYQNVFSVFYFFFCSAHVFVRKLEVLHFFGRFFATNVHHTAFALSVCVTSATRVHVLD